MFLNYCNSLAIIRLECIHINITKLNFHNAIDYTFAYNVNGSLIVHKDVPKALSECRQTCSQMCPEGIVPLLKAHCIP